MDESYFIKVRQSYTGKYAYIVYDAAETRRAHSKAAFKSREAAYKGGCKKVRQLEDNAHV